MSQFHFCYSGQAKRDPACALQGESGNIKEFWIPACAGMTTFQHSDIVSKGGWLGDVRVLVKKDYPLLVTEEA